TKLTIVTNEFLVGESIDPVVRATIYQHLLAHGAELRPNERVTRIDERAVCLANLYYKAESRIEEVDLLVAWHGRLPRNDLAEVPPRHGSRILVVGDAVAPRTVTQAVAEGAVAARSI